MAPEGGARVDDGRAVRRGDPRLDVEGRVGAQRDFLIGTATDIAGGLRGFWMFEDDVPPDLRREPPSVYPPEDAERVQRDREHLEASRRAWWVIETRCSTPPSR